MMYPSGEYKLLIDTLVINALINDKDMYFTKKRKPSLFKKLLVVIRAI